MWQVRDTGALLSPSHGTGEYQPRGEHYCWVGALLGDKASCIITALLAILWPPRNQTTKHYKFVFEPAFRLNTTKAQTKFRKPQYLRTASTGEQPSIGPAQQGSKVHTGNTFVSTRVRQPKQAGMKEQVRCCWEPCAMYEYYLKKMFFFPLSLCCS